MTHQVQATLSAFALALSALFGLAACAVSDKEQAQITAANEQQAMAIVQQFAGQLKPKLQAAISSGGPVHAIDICAVAAPQIAADLSAQSGWTITRVSNRNRNPNAIPDHWEAAAIATFEQQLAQGQNPATMKLSETTSAGYRFAKPQLAEPLCLMCHGQSIAPEVEQALQLHYPQDLATGYKAGQIRGIFSLLKPN